MLDAGASTTSSTPLPHFFMSRPKGIVGDDRTLDDAVDTMNR